jgi:hypothetical protein
MTRALEHLVQRFEDRRITRRELVRALAARTAIHGAAAAGQTAAVVQAPTLDHTSLAVTDVERSAE